MTFTMKTTALSLCALLLGGCAQVDDASLQLLSSSAPAVALIHETLLHGEVVLNPDRSGTVELASSGSVVLRCAGALRFTATETGTMHLRCSDGSEARLSFAAIGPVSGHGSGLSAHGPVSLSYGMTPAQSAAYLQPPAGKRLVAGPLGLELQSN